MDVQDAVNQAQAHLKNALELAQRPVGKEELLYMWDNQITALDNFLADTEVVKDKLLDRAREQLRDAKKRLTDTVVSFEAQQEGLEVDEEDPAPEEWVSTYEEMASEMLELAKEALDQKVKEVQDLVKWEEPLAVINGYLADSEPFQEMSKDLRRARSMVRVARRDLQGRIKDVVSQWREHAEAGGDDED
jgi:hypothetical protein